MKIQNLAKDINMLLEKTFFKKTFYFFIFLFFKMCDYFLNKISYFDDFQFFIKNVDYKVLGQGMKYRIGDYEIYMYDKDISKYNSERYYFYKNLKLI